MPARFLRRQQSRPLRPPSGHSRSKTSSPCALLSPTAKKAAFPDLSNEALTAAYPGRCQSLTQVLSTADARLSGLTEKTR